MARDTRRGGKKKVSKNIAAGVAHVNSSFNNTKILISDVQGTPFHGLLQGRWGLKDRANRHPMLHRWRQRMLGAKRKIMA